MQNQAIEILYFDQNDRFKDQLPRTGELAERLASSNVDDWYLVKLSQSVHWEAQDYWHLLIRSRWQGKELSSGEPVSIFILLVSAERLPLSEPINPESFPHVAWGMAKLTAV